MTKNTAIVLIILSIILAAAGAFKIASGADIIGWALIGSAPATFISAVVLLALDKIYLVLDDSNDILRDLRKKLATNPDP